MAGSDKETRRVDPGRDSNQSTNKVSKAAVSKAAGSKAAGAKTKSELKQQDAEWGFESGKGGMASEARMGMFIIVVLVGAFGFLVYHKFDLRQRQLLAAKMGAPADEVAAQKAAQDHAQEFNEFQSGADVTETPFRSQTVEPRQETRATAAADLNTRLAMADSGSRASDSQGQIFGQESEPDTGFDAQNPAFDDQQESAAFMRHANSGSMAQESASEFHSTEDLHDDFSNAFPEFNSQEAVELQAIQPGSQPEIATAIEPVSQVPVNDALLPVIDDSPEFNSFVATPETPTSQDVAVNPFAARSGNDAESFVPSAESPTEFFAAVEAEPVDQPEFGSPVDPFQPASTSDTDVAEVRSTEFDSPELLPLMPLEPADEHLGPTGDHSEFATQEQEFDPSNAIAMLEPQPDVNMFEDPAEPPKPDARSRSFPVAPEPDAPAFPGFDSGPPAFDPEPEIESFDDSGEPPEQIVPSGDPNLFDEPFDVIAEPSDPVAQTSQGAEAPFSRGSVAETATFDVSPTVVRQRPYDSENQDVSGIDVNAPGVGVAHFVESPGQIKLTAATEECAICEVQEKDNYWTISRRAYGTSRYFSSLAEYNRHRVPDPRKLRPGMKVLVPDPKILEAKYPEFFKDLRRKEQRPKPRGYFLQSDGTPAYRVGQRETLSEISQKHLGRASRWIQIYRMNRQILQDPNKLKPGIVIKLPDDATNVQLRP